MASAPSIFGDVPAWPDRAGPAPIGHNTAPLDEEARAKFRDQLLSEHPQFMQRLDDLEAAAGRVDVHDDDTLGRAGDLVKMFRSHAKHITETHEAVKKPYLEAGRAVDAQKNTLCGRLDDMKRQVEPKMNTYLAAKEAEQRAERERIAAEQRRLAEQAQAAERERQRAEQEAIEAARAATNDDERAAAEERRVAAAQAAEEAQAAAALAPAAAAKAEPVRSDAGSTVSGKQVWNSKVDDYPKAFKAVKDDAAVREAIDKAIARLVRAGKREIPGTTIWPTTQAIAR